MNRRGELGVGVGDVQGIAASANIPLGMICVKSFQRCLTHNLHMIIQGLDGGNQGRLSSIHGHHSENSCDFFLKTSANTFKLYFLPTYQSSWVVEVMK